MTELVFASAAKSAVGLVRSSNEDSAMTDLRLIAVADGMGGHAGGEVASASAVSYLAGIAHTLSSSEIDQDSADDLFINSVRAISAEIKSAAFENPSLEGMGTTLTAISLNGQRASLLHIGDSRGYFMRGNVIEQLTVDHTVVQELITSGAITQIDALNHPQRSILTQALMGDEKAEAALQIFDVREGDRFILATDGLSSVLTEKEIKSLVKGKSREEAVSALVDATYINGAPDNVTVLVADIVTAVGVKSESAVELFGAAKR